MITNFKLALQPIRVKLAGGYVTRTRAAPARRGPSRRVGSSVSDGGLPAAQPPACDSELETGLQETRDSTGLPAWPGSRR